MLKGLRRLQTSVAREYSRVAELWRFFSGPRRDRRFMHYASGEISGPVPTVCSVTVVRIVARNTDWTVPDYPRRGEHGFQINGRAR